MDRSSKTVSVSQTVASSYASSPYHAVFIATAVFSFISAATAACGAALPWLTLNTGVGVELDMYPFRQCIKTTILDSTNTVCGYLEFDLNSIVNNKYYAFFGGFASAISVLFAMIAFIVSLGRWCGIVGVQWFLFFGALFQATAGALGIYWWWDLYRTLVGDVWSIGLYLVLVSLFFSLLGMLTVCLGACCVCCCRRDDMNTIEEYGNRKRSVRQTVTVVNAASPLRENEYGSGRGSTHRENDPESDEENQYPQRSTSSSKGKAKGKSSSTSRAERVKSVQQQSSTTNRTNNDDPENSNGGGKEEEPPKASSWKITSLFRSSGKKNTKKTKGSSSNAAEETKNPVYQAVTPVNDYNTIPREPLSDEQLLKRTLVMVGAVDGDVSTEEDMRLLIPRVQNSIEYIAEKSGTEMNESILNEITLAAMKAIFEATRVDLVRSRKWLTIVKTTIEDNHA